ncbi:serine protease-like protein [Dinothrombium tinctorium]|uniref:Serine protease-like protein n=1 Tax=Dinothrombium tinctorium TaxID=1965070 RepID=A0A3S3PIB7_9ACAR|nr:serine protease-like protein [Dinothrombium tinctorium]
MTFIYVSFLTNVNSRKFKVKKSTKHPYYKQKFVGKYDIGILILETPLNFNEIRVNPICLPSPFDSTVEDETFSVAGFGYTENYSHPRSLLETNLTEFNFYECKVAYQNTIVSLNEDLVFCAIGKDSNICNRDNGSPAMLSGENGRKYIFGVASVGIQNKDGLCDPSAPSVWTRVNSVLPYIFTSFEMNGVC